MLGNFVNAVGLDKRDDQSNDIGQVGHYAGDGHKPYHSDSEGEYRKTRKEER